MLRVVVLIVLMVVAPMSMLAAEWSHYVNARFGAAIDVPPGFAAEGPEPENGDGRVFRSADGSAELRVWGGNLIEEDLAVAARQAISTAEADGWTVSYKVIKSSWFVYSGTRDGRITYVRSEISCGGGQTVNFQFEYPAAANDRFGSLVARLGKSLHAERGLDCPS